MRRAQQAPITPDIVSSLTTSSLLDGIMRGRARSEKGCQSRPLTGTRQLSVPSVNFSSGAPPQNILSTVTTLNMLTRLEHRVGMQLAGQEHLFSSSANCTRPTPPSNCVGFAGMMNTGTFSITFSDYHNFTLLSNTVFAAGQNEGASDGLSMGTNISAIDSAQTQKTFVCRHACGTSGLFPDN